MNNFFASFRLAGTGALILQIAFATGAFSMIATLLSAKTRHEIAPDEMLHIRLYDRAKIPTGTLQWAMAETNRLFKTARIKLEWERPPFEAPEDCGVDVSAPGAHRTHIERQYLVVRILPAMAANVVPGALGFALPNADTGAHAIVFYDRIAITARNWDVTPYAVLGGAMAHEIGHVLLRSSDHSTIGLMQAHWNGATWHLVSQGLLGFLPDEKARMRQRVLRVGSR